MHLLRYFLPLLEFEIWMDFIGINDLECLNESQYLFQRLPKLRPEPKWCATFK